MSPAAAENATAASQKALAGLAGAGLDRSVAAAQQAQAAAEAEKKLAEKADRIVGSPGKPPGSATSWRDATMALKVLGPVDPAKGKGIAAKAKEAADQAAAEVQKQKDALKKVADTKDALTQAIPVLDADAKALKQDADALAAEKDAAEQDVKDLNDALRTAKARVKKAAADKKAKEAAAAEQYLITSVIVACAVKTGLLKTAVAKATEEAAAADRALDDLQKQLKKATKALPSKRVRASNAAAAARIAQKALDDATKTKADLDAVLAKKKQLEDAAGAAAAANTAAQAAKDSLVQKRLTKLAAEGHGPQRHQESDPAARRQKCGERALYKNDPENGTQLQNDGRIHVAAETATSVPSKDDYVRAEAICRMELFKMAKAGTANVAGQTVKPKLTDLFKNPSVDCTGLQDSRPPAARPMVVSANGLVREIPLKPPPPAPPLFHPPPVAAIPPNPAPPIPAFNADQKQMIKSAIVDVVAQGGDPANFNAAVNGPAFQADYSTFYNDPANVAALTPAQLKAGAMAAALAPATAHAMAPPPPLNPPSAPALPAQMDKPAIDAAITANTVPTTFADPNLTATSVFRPVDPAKPKGDWNMVTLYPECD